MDAEGNSTDASTSAALNCNAADLPTQSIGPSRHYSFTTPIEVPAGKSGELLLHYTSGAWEWPLTT